MAVQGIINRMRGPNLWKTRDPRSVWQRKRETLRCSARSRQNKYLGKSNTSRMGF